MKNALSAHGGTLGVIITFSTLFSTHAVRAQTYSITDLGTLGGPNSAASAINSSGVVVGGADTNIGIFHAVSFTNGVLRDLGTLGGLNSSAEDINNAGQIVGFANLASGEQRAFLYTGGTMQDLGALLAGSTNSAAHAINTGGAIVGDYHSSDGIQRPFIYSGGTAQGLGFDGLANDINESGQIVGYEWTGSGGKSGFIFSDGQKQYVGTLGGNDTSAIRINNNGQVVGNSLTAAGTYHGFLYQNGNIRDLGTLGGTASAAQGINNQGVVVGQAKDAQGIFRAYVYSNGAMLDLNSLTPSGSGWVLTSATAINDVGQIVGFGAFNGQTRGFLLTPESTNLVLSLDGSGDYVTIPSSPDLQNPDSITLETWVKPSKYGRFVNKGDGLDVNTQRSYEMEAGGGTVAIAIFLGQSTYATLQAPAPDNIWIHLAATYSSAEGLLQFYTNGVLAASTTNDAHGTLSLKGQKLRQTDLPLILGATLPFPETYGAGLMDEIRIWNKPRSAEEILGDMSCRLMGSEPNLVGYWNFDDGTAKDRTSRGHDGTFSGDVRTTPSADVIQSDCSPTIQPNKILSFDGSGDYVTIPSAADLQNPSEITVEAWIYPTSTPGNQFGSFINKGDGQSATSARTYELRWFPDGNIGIWFFLDHVDGTPDAANIGAPMAANAWTHIAATFNSDQGIARFYTNGTLVVETSSLNGTPVVGRKLRQSDLPVVLGWTPSFDNTFASGYMDEVRIWKVSRSPEEIGRWFSCKMPSTTRGLAGYWNFDDGTARDSTGNGRDGTFTGDAHVDSSTLSLCIPLIFTSADKSTDQPLSFTLFGATSNCRIDASTNLLDWTPLVTLPATNGLINWSDADSINFGRRFYRAVLP